MSTTLITNSGSKQGTNNSNTTALMQPQQFGILQQNSAFNNSVSNVNVQQLMATQTIFNSLTSEQRLIAQQLAAESIQMSLLQQEIPKNLKVNFFFLLNF